MPFPNWCCLFLIHLDATDTGSGEAFFLTDDNSPPLHAAFSQLFRLYIIESSRKAVYSLTIAEAFLIEVSLTIHWIYDSL